MKFFEAHGHAVVPSSSLIPDDPSVLLTTAGMQQFKPYYTVKADPLKDFGSKNTASIQKSFRTSDIEEVGDERHLTFFEMMGNFSFGGYFKEEAIKLAHEFITREMHIPISYVTVFQGSDTVPKDEESRKIWNSLGIMDVREEGIEDVFWGPTGSSGPCGPTTEIYCKNGRGQDIEIWNIVFNEFMCSSSREDLLAGKADLTPLPQKGIDTGMGLERLAMVAQQTSTIFETDLFAPIMLAIVPLGSDIPVEKIRQVADHLRASVFLIGDGIEPSNTGRGYILRRLIRRAMVTDYKFMSARLNREFYRKPVMAAIDLYGQEDKYPVLRQKEQEILNMIGEETNKFSATLERGIRELEKMEHISGTEAFNLYQSFGLPPEVTYEFKPFDWQEFNIAKETHQAASTVGAEKKFGGHGLILDTGELKASSEEELKKVTRLHTATHLMQAALRKVLGEEVKQMGSDITAERTRFDFSFPRKVEAGELRQVEDLVNEVVQKNYVMEAKEMPFVEALKTGALHFFRDKYPENVNVYSVFDKNTGEVFSHELCGGPHVHNTAEIGKFKILKEESSSAGVRRIRAIVE